ncbi:DUF4342 domain-containing protein [Promineifilum sp.]|uniref:DUF4342 domain-containing protein n=1 Tax=Promineifilum sp. TaxID=2664178 RepID=UPI0035AE73CF
MSDNNHIHIEEELHDMAHEAKSTARRFTKEVSVRGSDLRETVGRLAKEATVRKITVKTQSGKTLVEMPLALGALGALIIGPWSAALLAAAWVTRASILIEYIEPAVAEAEAAVEAAVEKVEAAIA